MQHVPRDNMHNITLTLRKTRGSFLITNKDGFMNDPIPQDDKKEVFSPIISNPLADLQHSKINIVGVAFLIAVM